MTLQAELTKYGIHDVKEIIRIVQQMWAKTEMLLFSLAYREPVKPRSRQTPNDNSSVMTNTVGTTKVCLISKGVVMRKPSTSYTGKVLTMSPV